jgi:multiple sugar transport system permease protein
MRISAKRIVMHLLLGGLALVTLVPFAYLASASLKTNEDYFAFLFLPHGGRWLDIAWERLTLHHYERLFRELQFARHVFNSVFFAAVTSVVATTCCAMGGYALAKFRFRGRRLATHVVLAALVIPGVLLLAPTYQMLYWFGMLDSYTGLIIPALAPAFGVYLFLQAMLNALPDELLEAARIDGCGEVRLFFAVALPLVRPMVGAFLLITYLACWNNFIGPQIVLQSPEKFPLAVAVAQLRGTYSQEYGMLMAGTLVSILPVVVLFLMLQRDFVAGLTSGAVKG